jgi:hypothetical protein
LDWLKPRVEEIVAEAERQIPSALSDAGLRLDATARHPTYTMESGFITVAVDEKKLVATAAARGGSPRKAPLDPVAVAQVAVDVRDRVFRREDAHVDLQKLVAAFRAIQGGNPFGESEDVPIEAIRSHLTVKGQPIPADEFNVDLAAVVRTTADAGHPRIVLSNTRDTKSGILLYGLEEAGYIGYIRIEGE